MLTIKAESPVLSPVVVVAFVVNIYVALHSDLIRTTKTSLFIFIYIVSLPYFHSRNEFMVRCIYI